MDYCTFNYLINSIPTGTKPGLRKWRFFLILVSFICAAIDLQAQTKGLIIKPASTVGRTVLDPNNDGYVSLTDEGFENNDEAESELPFTRMVLPQAEPASDVSTGPNCGFTDFVDAPDEYSSAYFYLHNDGADTNLVFRFRLGGYAPNSKGYSVLIDTDGKFGNTGPDADPNYVSGNPGFEMEIILTTNFGVRLYDTDGTANPTLLTTMPYSDYAQISIAHSENCSTNDYFYDFYMPLATIQSYFPWFTSATPVRMVPNTVINTLSALRGSISDMAGFDNSAYGNNIEKAWTDYINLHPAVTLDDAPGGFAPARSAAPVVNGSILTTATSISGTSTEADGTTIRVYRNSSLLGTTTVSASNWTLTGVSGLVLNDTIHATAEATGKSVSINSNIVNVIENTNCTGVPTIGCSSRKGMTGNGPAGAPTGTTIRIYGPDNPSTLLATVTTNGSNAWGYNCNGGASCTSGGNCMARGTYYVTAQIDGSCESAKTTKVCINTSGTTATPVISTNPILPSTTSISGTATSGATVYLYKDGFYVTSATATGGNWTFNSQTFIYGQVVNVFAISGTACISAAATRTVSSSDTTTAPIVNSPIVNGATSVSGTSSEAVGTKIYIYRDGSLIDSTTVNAFGTWTKTGLTALTTGQTIKATAHAAGKNVSGDSNTVTVLGTSTAPVVTGTYTEGGTAVSGTSGMADGTVIKVYIDGVELGETTVTSGAWTLSGLSAAYNDLYAGGVLTATATGSGLGESAHSASVMVSCSNPLDNLELDILMDSTCLNASAQIMLLNSQSGVIYTLKDEAVENNRGSSRLGDGDDIVLATVRLTQTETFKVHALKLPQTTCTSVLNDSAVVLVKYPEDISGLGADDYLWLGNSGDSTWNNGANWIIWNGTSFQLTDEAPAIDNNVVIKKTQSCIINIPHVVTSLTENSVCRNITIEEDALLVMENSDSNRILTVTGNWNNYGLFLANDGTVRFNGGTLQTIFNQTGQENFNNVIIESTNTTVQLLSDINLSEQGTLHLDSGVVALNEHTLTINNSAQSAITRNAGHILSESVAGLGTLYRDIGINTDTDYLFPMGNTNGDYIPVTMKLKSGNIGLAGVSTFFSDLSESEPILPAGEDAVTNFNEKDEYINRFWHLYSNISPGTYNVDVTYSFVSTEEPVVGIPYTDEGGMFMQRYDKNSDSWDTPLPVQTYDHSSRTIMVYGITGFSWWGGRNIFGIGLPIELLYFTGKCQGNKAGLQWATATEVNSERFTIMKSLDGFNFAPVASIPASGNSSETKHYEFEDYDYRPGQVSYYRLVQVDMDGAYEEFNIVSANCGINAIESSVFPNPANDFAMISVKDDFKSIQIYNTANQLVYENQNTGGNTNFRINTSIFPPGIYIVKLNNSSSQECKKLVINR